jgi:hypothetical protein
MRVTTLKICLLISVVLIYILGVSSSVVTASADVDESLNQPVVNDSNTVETAGDEDGVQNQSESSDITQNGITSTADSTAPNDLNSVNESIADNNSTKGTAQQISTKNERERLSFLTSNKMIAFYIAIGLSVIAIIAWLLLRKTLRTRLRMEKTMRKDPDIDEYLVVFDWTPKVLYFPTIIASFIVAVLMYLHEGEIWFFSSLNANLITNIWFVIFFFNFLTEEYNITITVLLTSLLSIGFLLLWLHLFGWVADFLGLFKRFTLHINSTVYLLVSVIGLLAIIISWLKGLFYYVTITPNYLNLQEGPTESGEQIGREDYNTRIDTSDFLERLLGFGKIVITFKDKKRQPITLLVYAIRKRAQLLEKVRAKFVIDHPERDMVRITKSVNKRDITEPGKNKPS